MQVKVLVGQPFDIVKVVSDSLLDSRLRIFNTLLSECKQLQKGRTRACYNALAVF